MGNRIKEIRFETDKNGEHKVIDCGNGKTIRILKKPSESYKKKLDDLKKREKAAEEKRTNKAAEEKLIKDKMRELAIEQLKSEGKL